MIFSVRRVELAPLVALLLSLMVLLTLHLEFPARHWNWFAFGLVCGLTSLASPVALSVLPFLWGWLWHRLRGPAARPGRGLATAALAFLACVSPWLVRNYATFHRFIPLRSNFGLELRLGNNPQAFGSPVSPLHPAYNSAELQQYRQMGEVAYMDEKKREALQFIAQRPGAFARLTLLRISYWWSSNWQIRGTGRRAEWAGAGIWFGFAMQSALALLGLVLALRNRKQEAVPYALLLAVCPLVYYVVYYQLRYRHPLEPVMVVLCV
ncbi:MAG: hypothetical protein HY237_12330 [Acidobacteria bacterium]|nr:hypothetical protein [Acidobacteriota bacterium]